MNYSKNINGLISRMINSSTLLFISLFIILTGCSKDFNEDGLPYGSPLDLSISVAGVNDPDLSTSLRASLNNQIGLALPEKQNTVTVSNGDFSMGIISSEENLPTDIFENNANTKTKYAATTENMKNGIRYRVILYVANTGKLYSSFEAKAGESTNIAATSGETYKWYAYSYNSTDPIPEVSDLENPSITTPTTTTLLYASGTIKPTTNKTPLPITFKHQLTQLKVEIREGMRRILSATGKFDSPDYVKTCSFDLKNGTKGALTSANITDLTFVDVVEGSGDLQLITSEAKYYTADESINTFDVEMNSISVQYTNTQTKTLTSEIPDNGKIRFSFNGVSNSKGKLLHGTMKLNFLLPHFNILVVSNSNDNNGFRLGPNSRGGQFIRDSRNFGPNSNYVKTKGLILSPVDQSTLMDNNNNGYGWDRFKALMNDPAKYPDVLIIANWYNYLDDECWVLVNKYLEAGGNVFYTHDEYSNERFARKGIANILGVDPATIDMNKHSEDGGVYKYNDTEEAGEDALILNGPFGNVKNSYWGQDRSGSTYVIGFDPSKVVVYTNKSRNRRKPNFTGPSATFFRTKSKAFFFVGDGGFFCNPNSSYGADNDKNFYGDNSDNQNSRFPFRTDVNNFPYSPPFGYRPVNPSEDYGLIPNSNGQYKVSNAAHFGNTIAWMLNRAHYYSINRTANP